MLAGDRASSDTCFASKSAVSLPLATSPGRPRCPYAAPAQLTWLLFFSRAPVNQSALRAFYRLKARDTNGENKNDRYCCTGQLLFPGRMDRMGAVFLDPPLQDRQIPIRSAIPSAAAAGFQPEPAGLCRNTRRQAVSRWAGDGTHHPLRTYPEQHTGRDHHHLFRGCPAGAESKIGRAHV